MAPRQVLRAVRELRGRSDLETWEVAVTGKLLVDGHAIGDARAQLYLVWGALSPELQTTFLPYMQKAIHRPDPQAFLRYIKATLEEPNKIWKAGQRLTKLRQRSDQSASDYLPVFEGALFQAGGGEWPDRARILLLINGLNTTTRACLDREVWPDEYAVFTQLLRRLDSSFVSVTPIPTSAPASTRSRASTYDGDPMDTSVGAVQAPAGLRRCFICGDPGHFARRCTRKKTAGVEPRGSTGLAALSARPTYVESRLEAAREYLVAAKRVEDLDAYDDVVALDT